MVRCKTQQRTCVTRNVMVSANASNRAAAKLSNALTYGEATMVSANVSNRAAAKRSSALTYGEATMVSANTSNRATSICVSVGASIRLRKSDGNVRSGGENVSKIDGFRAKSAVE